jgi:hypothetical protein
MSLGSLNQDQLQSKLVRLAVELSVLKRLQINQDGYSIAVVHDGHITDAKAFPSGLQGWFRYVRHWITSEFSPGKTYATVKGVKEQLLLEMSREIKELAEALKKEKTPEWDPEKDVSIISEANIYSQKVHNLFKLTQNIDNIFKTIGASPKKDKAIEKAIENARLLGEALNSCKDRLNENITKYAQWMTEELRAAEQHPKALKRAKAYEKFAPVLKEIQQFQLQLAQRLVDKGGNDADLIELQKGVEITFRPVLDVYKALKEKVLDDSRERFEHHKKKALKHLNSIEKRPFIQLIQNCINYEKHDSQLKTEIEKLSRDLNMPSFINTDNSINYERLNTYVQDRQIHLNADRIVMLKEKSRLEKQAKLEKENLENQIAQEKKQNAAEWRSEEAFEGFFDASRSEFDEKQKKQAAELLQVEATKESVEKLSPDIEALDKKLNENKLELKGLRSAHAIFMKLANPIPGVDEELIPDKSKLQSSAG